MGTIPSDGSLRAAFKAWALSRIKADPNHPLNFLYDPKTGDWYPNTINFPDDPSVDSGHTTSNWTGKPPFLALEDSDFNRNKLFNARENKTRDGLFFEKEAVLIGKAPFQVPVEVKTALMYERLKPTNIPPGTVANSPRVKGARILPNSRQFVIDPVLPDRPPAIPMVGSNVTVNGKVGRLASNQAAVAMLGQAIGTVSTWLNEWGIQRQVEKELRTTRAKEIAEIHSRKQGALIIVRIQSFAFPDDTHYPNASLVGVDVVGGDNSEDALQRWQNEPKILRGPDPGCRIDTTYGWLSAPSSTNYANSPQPDAGPVQGDSKPRPIPVAPLR
jgi:hypothetical protein